MNRTGHTRREAIRLAGLAAVGAGAGTSLTGTAAAQSSGLSSWFSNTSNYEGVVDLRGRSEVTVEVGVEANEGAFGFGPPAVRVDPGTTVTWEWTGQGGGHNVVAQEGPASFESETVSEAGHTFSHTFERDGVTTYVCTPHQALGMKGAVVVGAEAAADAPSVQPAGSGVLGTGFSAADAGTLGFGGLLAAALVALAGRAAGRADAGRSRTRREG